MSKHSFMDSILNRPSQRYTEPLDPKPSRKSRHQAPSDLPNAPNRPDSILAGNMFKSAGPGSLQHGGGVYSQAPSVRSGKSNTSRFSLFRKKGRAPSVSGSVYYDGSSSVAPTDISASPSKARWWESGGLTRNNYSSRPPSVAGSVFSEPEAAGPPGFPRISDSLGRAPPRGARSDYGGSSSRKRYSSQTSAPPLPSLTDKGSVSSMRLQSGVAPLGQQQPNLMRQASSASLARAPSMSGPNAAELARPISPAASMGRTRRTSQGAANGSSDWNSFVKSMAGTEVAQMWESMPTLAPKAPRTSEKRSSMVANRIRKELEQDAQYQQVQRDPGVIQQDLLARAASQVIGTVPQAPMSTLSEHHLASQPIHLEPGQVVAPISPVYSPVASTSSVNVAQMPASMSMQASAVMDGTGASVPMAVPQAVAPVTVLHAPQPQQYYVQPQVQPQAMPQQYVQAVPAPVPQEQREATTAAPQRLVPGQGPVQAAMVAPALPPVAMSPPAQTYAPVAVQAPRAEPPAPMAVPLAVTAPTPVTPEPTRSAPQQVVTPATISPASAPLAPPTTAQYLADRVDEEGSDDEESEPEEVSSDESEDSDETSSDEGLVGGGQPTLDVVAEEDEEGSSVGHAYHHEMRSHKSIKGKGPSRNYDDYEARLHLRQASAQSQADSSRDEDTARSGVQIRVSEPSDSRQIPTDAAGLSQPGVSLSSTTSSSVQPESQTEAVAIAQPALAQAVAAPVLAAKDRPRLVTRPSEGSDYASATSGRSTPTARDQADEEDAEDEAAVVASIAQAPIGAKTAEGMSSTDTASIRPSVRTSRSSRPDTAQRRLSEVSLGTSFAASGILRRPESSLRRAGDGDSDSDAERSDEDADLRSKSLAEQDRLRKMNVGEDFFGPSLSNILESFDRINYSDSTVNKMKRELSQSSAKANGDATAPISNGIDANAQQAINDVRQKRADAEGKRRNSADTTGVAPSFAAVWLLNQAQGSNDSAAARGGLTDDAGDKTVTASQAHAGANTAVTLPEEPKVSVLARPRPVARKPKEEEEVSPAEAQVVAEKPQEAVRQVTSNAMATSGPQPIVPNADAASAATQSNETTPKKATEVVAAKDSPTPVKSAAKPKQPRSLADTLFGISFRSPSKDKKEKKEKKEKAKKEKKDKKDKEKKEKKDRSTHSRTTSVDSTASASNRSDSSSVVSTPASPSVKSLGKQRATEDPSIAATPSQQPNGIVPSETTTNFATPPQSMGNLQSAAGVASSPEKFHTAHDLKALANTAVPVYPTDVKALPVMQNGAAGKDQMEADRALLVPAVGSTNTEGAVNGDHSAPPTSSEASLASTALTSPEAEAASKPMDADRAVVTEAAASQPTAVAPQPSTTEMPEKRLVMPPPPALEEVMAPSQEDRTPLGKPSEVPAVGINLIPPTPPALESRNSYTSSQAPGTSTIDEYGEDAAPHRPSLMSRSSSQRTAVRADTKPNGSSEGVSRSKSMAPTKKGIWQEYKGKGLSLPPGLVATTIDSSELRRLTGQDKKLPSQPAASTAAAVPGSVHLNGAAPALPVKPVVGQIVPTAPTSVLESPPRPPRATPSPSPKSRRSSGSLSPLPPQSPAVARILADAPPVPQIPVGYQSASSVSGPSSRLYAPSIASSEPDWDSRPVSPAPSAVPSQSGRSVGSHVSSSVHSASYRSSPRPEYSYVNHHELSPYAKKMRALSPSPAVPTLSQTGNRHSLMSAINEWESQVPDREETVAGLSPYPSRPTSPSPSPYPTLPASTVSRTSSVISSISSPAVVRNAPLGAATNQYLQPPIARSLMSHDGLSAVSESALESLNPPSVVEGRSGASSVNSSSPSASQSALSLSSTIPTSMPTVPTSYRPNKDPKRFTTNADDLLNNRTTMQTVAVTSGAFANRSKSVVKRKKSSDIGGDRRTSTDIPVHLQDELAVTTLSLTAHTPPPRKIGSHQVLVQVIAVAIDETDKLLLREKIRAENAFGFVPGRSFCGRIVECGYEVKKMRKGDIIFGLQDSRKCGALAEFMVVDHNRICHAPSDCLTTEQIAALPSAGVMAHQLMAHCSQLPRGARVLILNAHDGVGLLTLQESVGLGLVIVAQCPPTISDGVAVCQANGAHEVVIGEPLWAINSLHESSFDLIVDTVGGRKIYDASRRILASDGQYCTCYGDEHGTNNPNLKSHFRSLRRAFFKKDKKNLGYEWVGVDTGEDCKEALEAVKRAAERGDVCPRLRSVLPFADAGRAFEVGSRKVDDEPGAIVVRVS